jgi:hypothetical protein
MGFSLRTLSLSLQQTMETDHQTILLLQTDKQSKRNQQKKWSSCSKQGEKVAESQEKVRDDGEDVNERERERDEMELFCLEM